MIYATAPIDAPIDQGDLIDGCPLFELQTFAINQPLSNPAVEFHRVIVLTQTCDLANEKTSVVTIAEVQAAQYFVDAGILKPSDIKGPLRSGRVWGLYFLPADAALSLPEMILDLRRLHTVKLDMLRTLCKGGKRPRRIQPLYREHLAKHFADTFSRIGLPRPYETT